MRYRIFDNCYRILATYYFLETFCKTVVLPNLCIFANSSEGLLGRNPHLWLINCGFEFAQALILDKTPWFF